jgi:hypothetical protein
MTKLSVTSRNFAKATKSSKLWSAQDILCFFMVIRTISDYFSYSIITETVGFYCAVRNESSNAIQVTVCFGRGKERIIMLNCWLFPAALLSCTNTLFTF